MSHDPQILVPKIWRAVDRLRRFPRRRTPNFSAVSKVDELMQKRFGGLAICAGCAWRYRDAIRRWGYYRHPDIKFTGNVCDFCERMFDELPLWPKEEHPYPTRQQHATASARFGVRGAPHLYDVRERRAAACIR